jgi:1,4-dihydroxy-2-naphthoate polyprenyltransferase
VPIGLLTANILVVNNYRDMETDAAAGKRTLVVRFGRGAARAQFVGSLAIGFLVPVIFTVRDHRLRGLLPLILLPLAWTHGRRLRDSKTPSERIALLGDTGKLLALFAVLFAIGLA